MSRLFVRYVTFKNLVFVALAGLCLAWVGCRATEGGEASPRSTGEQPALSFTDVTQESGLGSFRHETGATGDKWFPETMGSGGGFIDYNGDGWEDVLLVHGGTWDPAAQQKPVLWLYRNDGDGTFTDVTDSTGLGDLKAYGLGIAVADYDGDGDEDVYLTTLAENMLLRNDDGRFTEVGRQAGVAGAPVWSSSAVFFDADRDGWLDLYAGNYVKWTPETDIYCSLDGKEKDYCTPETYQGIPSRFYHNDGDGTFSDWTEKAGFLPAPGKSLGVTAADFNRDGWPDLVVANDTQPDLLYMNDGDGTFTEQGAMSGMAYDENGKARAGMGVDVGVVDETGQETIFVGNFSREMIGVYRYGANGLFLDRAATSGIGQTSMLTLAFGLTLFDADLDGDLDLFVANGHVQPDIEEMQQGISYAEAPHLFINDGDGTFEDSAPEIGGALATRYVARAVACADYDRDGDVDVLITENDGPAHLLRNDLRSADGGAYANRHVLRVRTEGRESNRGGIGSRIIVKADGLSMERRIRSGSSYLAASEKTATFGLGPAEQADSVIVHWPSGTVDRYANVPADHVATVREGNPELALSPLTEGREIAGRE
ncbi:MAG TPA: CRTAC1 family protein [Rhodothermales bacterium]|nr:CRTAC1 family protein [Rhodothermales bacterium]